MKNASRTVFASAARTADVNSAEQLNNEHEGIRLVIDATAITATPSVVFTLQGKDEASGTWYDVIASAAITGVSTTVITVFPGAPVTANASDNDFLPAKWRVNANHADADSITYSVGAELF